MAIRYLLDVDYTLMAMTEGLPVFCHTLIDILKRKGVDSVDLLTKMDVIDAYPTRSLRIYVIAHLEKNGIRVNKVLTTLDDFFIKAGYIPHLRPGDIYEKLMKPVELAALTLKSIDKLEERYQSYFQHKTIAKKLAMVDFLVSKGLVSLEDRIEDILNNFSALTKNLDIYLKNHPLSSSDPDFNATCEVEVELINLPPGDAKDETVKFDRRSTLKEYCEKLQNRHDTYQLREDHTSEEIKIVDNYLETLASYRKLKYINTLIYQQQFGKHDSDKSKGIVYNMYVDTNPYQEEDVTCFIDDAKREQNTVLAAHQEHKRTHSLVTFYPPEQMPEFSNTNCYFDVATFKSELAKVYYRVLRHEGDRAMKEKNSRLAVECYKGAYLELDDFLDNTEKQQLKKDLLKEIKKAYDTNHPQKDYQSRELFIANLTSAHNHGDSKTQLRMIRREQDIHAVRCPHLYRSKYRQEDSNFSLSFKFTKPEPDQIDDIFKNKVLGFIQQVAILHNVKDDCFYILLELQSQLKYKKYHKAVTDTFTEINNKYLEMTPR